MVFGGRRSILNMKAVPKPMASKNMAELQKDTFRNKSASFGNEKSVSGRSPEDLSGAHHEAVFFCEDPDFDEFGEEVDPIVIDFENEFQSCGFRLASKSFGEQGQSRLPLKPVGCTGGRRAWSEGSLPYISAIHTSSSSAECLCETVQGIHSHKSCPRMDLTLPETCCFTCGSDWALDHTAWACFECGGYGLARPCGKCNGKCGARWSRDLKVTHATGEATWSGGCSLEKENSTVASATEIPKNSREQMPSRA